MSTATLPADWSIATPPELAGYLGVSVQKILAWVDSGELIAHNVATNASTRPRHRIDRADFEQFWQSRASSTPQARPHKPRAHARADWREIL